MSKCTTSKWAHVDGEAGGWIWDLVHVEYMLYHWATPLPLTRPWGDPLCYFYFVILGFSFWWSEEVHWVKCHHLRNYYTGCCLVSLKHQDYSLNDIFLILGFSHFCSPAPRSIQKSTVWKFLLPGEMRGKKITNFLHKSPAMLAQMECSSVWGQPASGFSQLESWPVRGKGVLPCQHLLSSRLIVCLCIRHMFWGGSHLWVQFLIYSSPLRIMPTKDFRKKETLKLSPIVRLKFFQTGGMNRANAGQRSKIGDQQTVMLLSLRKPIIVVGSLH